jgi:carbon monoxide dehydrogenase subunit G
MQVKLDKVIPIDGPASSGWQVLSDINEVAGCMPGAELTEQVDDTNYKGQVKMKAGPATAHFKGDLEVKRLDAGSRELRLVGKGADTKGTSNAVMDLTATIRDADGGGCELVGQAEVTVNGKIASLGGRLMTSVSDQVLKQFGDNFATKVVALGEGAEADAATHKLEEQPEELNGLAFVWAMIVDFFKRLFGGRAA